MKAVEGEIKKSVEKYQHNAQQNVFCPTLEHEVKNFEVRALTKTFLGLVEYHIWEEPRCPLYTRDNRDEEKPGCCVETGKSCPYTRFLDKGTLS